jgi:hypothetical protein
MIWLGILVALVVLLFAGFQYLAWYQRWESHNTRGMAYYGKPLTERRVLKKRIRWYVLPVLPLVRFLALGNKQQATMPGFEYEGVWGPPQVSSPEFSSAPRTISRDRRMCSSRRR